MISSISVGLALEGASQEANNAKDDRELTNFGGMEVDHMKDKVDEHGLLLETTAHLVKIENASPKSLLEELLSRKRLTGNITIKSDNAGLIRGGHLYNLRLLKTTVSDNTKLESVGIWGKGKTRFVVHGIHSEVLADFSLLLSELGAVVVTTGSVSAVLAGPSAGGMSISVPDHGIGPGGCGFSTSLDLIVHNTSGGATQLQDMTVTKALQDNLFGVRTEIVRGMEEGLCRALLAPTKVDQDSVSTDEAAGIVTAKALMKEAKNELPSFTIVGLEVGLVAAIVFLCSAFGIGLLVGGLWGGLCVHGCAPRKRDPSSYQQMQDANLVQEEQGKVASRSMRDLEVAAREESSGSQVVEVEEEKEAATLTQLC